MSSDGIKRVDLLRNLYQAREIPTNSEMVRELQQIKNEVKIANDERARKEEEITNATNSPYLPDQLFYKKEVVYNSLEETKWKEVKSAEQIKADTREQYLLSNLKKLNIL